ncbi:MAG: hypothetical protein R3A45_03095 [Bdellovibrionota bacterium]
MNLQLFQSGRTFFDGKNSIGSRIEGIFTFTDSFLKTHSYRLTSSKVLQFVLQNAQILNDASDFDRSSSTSFLAYAVYDRYLLKHPQKRTV